MDGMFYQSDLEQAHDAEVDPAPSLGKLVLVTFAFAIAVVGALVLASWAGIAIAVPAEFPFP